VTREEIREAVTKFATALEKLSRKPLQGNAR